MAKIVFNFFEAHMEDDEVSPFLKKIEEVLKNFAGEAYHFRYYLEEPSNTAQSKGDKNTLKSHNSGGYRTKRV
jgi:hypothetical protein